MNSRIRIAFILLLVALVGYAVYTHRGISEGNAYVTSAQCEGCHAVQYHSWQATLHPKMFRPVTGPQDLLGDFDSPSEVRTFKREDVQFVVGNRWEQIYVRMIDGEYYPLTAKWHIIQKKWVPAYVDDWKTVKMSYQCNGCHTTGFNAATLKFSEFGIGCEACHGPGGQHVQNRRKTQSPACGWCHKASGDAKPARKDIIRTVSPAVCAQCHDRGSNAGGEMAGKFSFPVNAVPGADLAQGFKSLGPADDKKGKFWWGQGISRARHQEYADWNRSKHAKALQNLHENKPTSCPKTGATDGCLSCHSTDQQLAGKDAKPGLDHAKFGVTCVACHEPHGVGKTMIRGGDGTAACGGCHIQNLARRAAELRKPHIPCPSNSVQCADCHMPRVVETGGFFSLRSHAFKIVTPMSTSGSKMPNSCQNGGCHQDRTAEWVLAAYQRHYPAEPKPAKQN